MNSFFKFGREMFIKHFSIFCVTFSFSFFFFNLKKSAGQDVEFPVKKIRIRYLFSGFINHYSFSATEDLWFHLSQRSTLLNQLYLL